MGNIFWSKKWHFLVTLNKWINRNVNKYVILNHYKMMLNYHYYYYLNQ